MDKKTEYQQVIREIDELLKHANGQSVLNKICQKSVSCKDCPLCLWDREWENWCCVLSDMALNEINTDMLDELRQSFVNTLNELEMAK
jgi:hypothetical protein